MMYSKYIIRQVILPASIFKIRSYINIDEDHRTGKYSTDLLRVCSLILLGDDVTVDICSVCVRFPKGKIDGEEERHSISNKRRRALFRYSHV